MLIRLFKDIRLSVNNSTLRILSITTLIFTFYLLTGCNTTDSSGEEMIYEYDFRESDASWEAFFTDFNVGWEDKMALTAEYRTLPEPLQTDQYAHFISAVNHSDDVKMLFRKQVDGLKPNTSYSVQFTIRFATSVPSGCFGNGGAPGEAVKVIADANTIKPEPFNDEPNEDYYLLNVQYLGDPLEWHQNVIMGDIANSRDCEDGYGYEIKEVSSGQNHTMVTSDEQGRAWLLFGTRSGFEGQTDLYYTYFKAEFR